jgi:NAD(P)-dependent dehydrogenase (short-subunit alcohol dehydrogenase family)
MSKVVLITGASRGIGFGLVQKYLALPNVQVVATSRDPANAKALHELTKTHHQLVVVPLDVNEEEAYPTVLRLLEERGVHHIDILIANAGVGDRSSSFLHTSAQKLREIFDTNVVGAFLTLKYFTPLVQRSTDRLVVVMSSVLGSIANVSGGYVAAPYRVSKSALNMLVASYVVDADIRAANIRAIALHPGWVQTDMGGAAAPLTTEQSTQGIVEVLERAVQAQATGQASDEFTRRLVDHNLAYVNYSGAVLEW